MKLKELLESKGEDFMIRWIDGKIVWELPNKNYTYSGYTQKDYDFWRNEISQAGYGSRWEQKRRHVYGRFEKAHREKRKRDEYYDAIDDYRNGPELRRRAKESELFADLD